MQTAEVIQTEVKTELSNALQVFDVKEAVLQDLEKSMDLKIKDAASEKVVRKYRQTTKSLQVKLNKRRLKINREHKERTDKAANILLDRLNPVYDNLDEKVKEVEAFREENKIRRELIEAEKIRKEQERINDIKSHFEAIDGCRRNALEYGISSEDIRFALSGLDAEKKFVTEERYQEFLSEAEGALANAITQVEAALNARVKFEKEQAELKAAQEAQAKADAESKAKRDAENKRLADERAAFEEQQRKFKEEQDRIAKEAAAKEKAKSDKLAAEKKALEDEKARIFFEENHKKEVEKAFQNSKYWVDHLLKNENYEGLAHRAHNLLKDIKHPDPFYGDRTEEFVELASELFDKIILFVHG